MLVEIPGKGLVLGFHSEMQRVFGNRLLKGRQVETARGSAVEWDVRGCVKAASDDPAVVAARQELADCATDVETTERELTELLARSRAQASLRVHRDLVRRMGGTSGEDHVLIAETEIRPRRDALRLTAAGVRRAMQRGDFMLRDGRAVLFGWACVPRSIEVESGVGPGGSVQLELCDERTSDGGTAYERVIRELEWSAVGSGSAVELVRVDGAEATVAETRIPIKSDPASGRWKFPSSELPVGAKYVARLFGPWGARDSNIVEIPAPVLPPLGPPKPPVPVPPKELTPLPDVVVDPSEIAGDPPATEDPPPKRSWWPWLLALFALLLLALAFLLWLLLPYPRTRANWDRPLVAEHLPRFVSDIDPPPVEPRRLTTDEYEGLPQGFDPNRDALVFDDPTRPSPVFVDDGQVYVPDGPGRLAPAGPVPQPPVSGGSPAEPPASPGDAQPKGGDGGASPPPSGGEPAAPTGADPTAPKANDPKPPPRKMPSLEPVPQTPSAEPKPSNPPKPEDPAKPADPATPAGPEKPADPPKPKEEAPPRRELPSLVPTGASPSGPKGSPSPAPAEAEPKPEQPAPASPPPTAPPAPVEPKPAAPSSPRPPEPDQIRDDREVRR